MTRRSIPTRLAPDLETSGPAGRPASATSLRPPPREQQGLARGPRAGQTPLRSYPVPARDRTAQPSTQPLQHSVGAIRGGGGKGERGENPEKGEGEKQERISPISFS